MGRKKIVNNLVTDIVSPSTVLSISNNVVIL